MDITGHFGSASCVIEVDRSDTLAQVKGKLVAELAPRARHVGVRMRGGGDIGEDGLRICDTEMDEGCAVELYSTGANITPGLLRHTEDTYTLTLSPCDRYLAEMRGDNSVVIFDTETHECLCRFPALVMSSPSFSPCSEWISSVNEEERECVEVHDVKTGALKHSFKGEGGERKATAWSPCGTKLLSWCRKGLQVRDIATGVVVHEWGNIVDCYYSMVVAGNKVAMFSNQLHANSAGITVWDYTTGEALFRMRPSAVQCVAVTPNKRFIAACCTNCVQVWNIETGERVFEDLSAKNWSDAAVSNDIVAAYSPRSEVLVLWSISTGEQLLNREIESNAGGSYGLAISSCGGVMMYGDSEAVKIVDISHLS